MKTRLIVLAMAAVVAAGACTSGPAPAPAPAPAPEQAPAAGATYTPVVSLNEMMVYVVDWHAEELWDAAMVPPKSDTEWAALRRAAVALAASGSLTKLSGSGPKDQQWTRQADWISHSQSMADARDTVALNTAGDALVVSCITCHREYKLDVPKIWTERQLPPEEQK